MSDGEMAVFGGVLGLIFGTLAVACGGGWELLPLLTLGSAGLAVLA